MSHATESKVAPSGRDHLTPKNRADFLRALADFQTELFRVEAGFLPVLKSWKLKREMAGLIFHDARRVQDLRTRCRELGGSNSAVHISRGTRGFELIEKLCQAPDGEQFFAILFSIVKPALAEILQKSIHDDLRVFDAPSAPVLEENVRQINDQIAWARRQPEYAGECFPAWRGEVEELAGRLSEALLAERILSVQPGKDSRKIGTLPILRSSIPEEFQICSAGTPPAETASYEDRALYHAHNFLMEIQAAESCASLLFEAPDMPWDFYFDLCRHMWDETRHCEFGEIKLKAMGKDIREMGLSNTAYVMRQALHPLDRYTALTTQEADAFPGKHAGLRDALAHGDELSARAWSYDIADETQHVRYGHKWIPLMIEQLDEPRNYEQLKRDAENWRREVLGAVYAPTARSFQKEP